MFPILLKQEKLLMTTKHSWERYLPFLWLYKWDHYKKKKKKKQICQKVTLEICWRNELGKKQKHVKCFVRVGSLRPAEKIWLDMWRFSWSEHYRRQANELCTCASQILTNLMRWDCGGDKEKGQRQEQPRNGNEDLSTAAIAHPLPSTTMIALTSWLRTSRSRFIFLLLCSPILLPFLCATFPLLCAVEICIRLCRRCHPRKDDHESRLCRCEEGSTEVLEEREVGLLQRYLEDQILLVGSVYDCGNEDEDSFLEADLDVDFFDSKSPLLHC